MQHEVLQKIYSQIAVGKVVLVIAENVQDMNWVHKELMKKIPTGEVTFNNRKCIKHRNGGIIDIESWHRLEHINAGKYHHAHVTDSVNVLLNKAVNVLKMIDGSGF